MFLGPVTDTLKSRLRTLLEAGIEALGFELVDVEFLPGTRAIVRIFIDAPGGVIVDDCESVSRYVSGVLDVEDPVPGQYALEVSSPGLDRPLVRPEHFRRFVGHTVQVETRVSVDGRRRFRGVLDSECEGRITLRCEDRTVELEVDALRSARLVPELPFGRRGS